MTGYLLLKTGAASFARRGACVIIRAANVSYVILKHYWARKYIPAGRVEENALVWLLNAFDNYIFLISRSILLFCFRRYKLGVDIPKSYLWAGAFLWKTSCRISHQKLRGEGLWRRWVLSGGNNVDFRVDWIWWWKCSSVLSNQTPFILSTPEEVTELLLMVQRNDQWRYFFNFNFNLKFNSHSLIISTRIRPFYNSIVLCECSQISQLFPSPPFIAGCCQSLGISLSHVCINRPFLLPVFLKMPT